MGKKGNRVNKHESVTCLMNVFADWNYIDEGRALMNAYFDMHVHSTFSIDGVSTMEDYCLVAEKSGIRAICFTEHVDFNSEEKNLSIVKDNRKQNFVVEDYFSELNRLRKKYSSIILLRQ